MSTITKEKKKQLRGKMRKPSKRRSPLTVISTYALSYCRTLSQLNINLQSVSFMVCFMGSKETQEMELSSEMVIYTIMIYTIKLEIVWTNYEHLHNTVHAIKSTEWQKDFFFLVKLLKAILWKTGVVWLRLWQKVYQDQSAHRGLMR